MRKYIFNFTKNFLKTFKKCTKIERNLVPLTRKLPVTYFYSITLKCITPLLTYSIISCITELIGKDGIAMFCNEFEIVLPQLTSPVNSLGMASMDVACAVQVFPGCRFNHK